MEVHETVKAMREIHQLTQEDIAERLGISVNGYSKLERGISKFNVDKLEKVAQIFNINVSELYSAKEKGFFCLFSENSQNNSNYYANSDMVSIENEKLKLLINHKDELLQQQQNEIRALKEVISLLKSK